MAAQLVVDSFLNGESRKRGKFRSNGNSLFLYDREVVRRTPDNRLEIKIHGNASITVKRFLSRIPNVTVCHRRFELLLNNAPWDGEWTVV